LKQFNAHWECLENNNHRLWECRKPEMELNSCVFEKLVRPLPYIQRHFHAHSYRGRLQLNMANADNQQGLKKTIPGAPENQTPVHLRPKQLYASFPGPQY
jgi:NADH dehydrogenase (ubiquinone) 1 alpha subcomplex subunit 8